MKKRIALLMGVLALSIFTACGDAADVDVDDIEIDEEWDEDRDEETDKDEDHDEDDDAHSDPVYDDETGGLLGYWEGESVFLLMFTFYPDGTYYYSTDGGMYGDGSYTLDGTDLLLVAAEDGYMRRFTYSDGELTDEDGTEYVKKHELSELSEDETDDEGFDGDDLSDILGYWEGVTMPPNDWFLFTSDEVFYCNRDNGYLERGNYEYYGYTVYLTYYPSGENDSFFLIDEDLLSYTPCDGLQRLSKDDGVDQWILDEFDD